LQYADDDARALYSALRAQEGKVYRKVHSVLLADGADEEPTAANIQDAIDLFADAGKDDSVVLFLAGYGVNENEQYYFLPQDARLKRGHWRKSSVIKWRVLQDALEESNGRRILNPRLERPRPN
jgi:uncharacterized caspase-like protein